MIKKDEFISDLERLINGSLNISDFQNKYLLGPNAVEVEGVTDGSVPNLVGNLGHLVAEDDPKESIEFKNMQKSELKKLINLLKNNADSHALDKFHFYGETE